MKIQPLSGCAVAFVLMGPCNSFAQEAAAGATLEEIVVTAERRESSIQETAASIAYVSGEELNRQGLTTLDEVVKNLAGVIVQSQAKGFTPAIRGLGSDLPPGTGEGAVATNFDGAYNIRAESGAAGYYDINRVEVLRGPQGTLYGRNATAGVVNIISNNPVLSQFGGYGSLEAGNYSLLRAEGALNMPLGEAFALRAAFATVNRDGYLTNGQEDNVAQSARVKALYQPGDDLSVLLGVEYIKIGGKGAGQVPSYPDDDAPSNPRFTPGTLVAGANVIDTSNSTVNYQSYKIWNQTDWDMGFGVVTFLPSYMAADSDSFGCFGSNCNKGAHDPKDLEQWSGELRLASPKDSAVQWVAGVYIYDYQTTIESDALSPAAQFSSNTYKARSKAAFGEVTVPIGDAFRLTGGLRETYDWKQSSSLTPPSSGTNDWKHFDWKVSGEYDLTNDSLVYATLSTGYRPGGFNLDNTVPFDQEEVLAYEIGSKNRFLDDRLQLNGAIFYYDYEGYQAFDFSAIPVPRFDFYNVESIDNYGAELELQSFVTDDDFVSLAAAYLHTEFTSDVFIHLNGISAPATNLIGYVLPHSPDWTVNGEYRRVLARTGDGQFSGRANVRYMTGQYVGPSEVPHAWQPEYVAGDVSLMYAAERGWSLTAYVKNVSDEPIKSRYVSGYNQLAAPRTWGFVVTAKFGDK